MLLALTFARKAARSLYLSTRDGESASSLVSGRRSPPVLLTKNRRLFIVDDDSMMRGIAKHVLTSEGFECTEAADGKESRSTCACQAH